MQTNERAPSQRGNTIQWPKNKEKKKQTYREAFEVYVVRVPLIVGLSFLFLPTHTTPLSCYSTRIRGSFHAAGAAVLTGTLLRKPDDTDTTSSRL